MVDLEAFVPRLQMILHKDSHPCSRYSLRSICLFSYCDTSSMLPVLHLLNNEAAGFITGVVLPIDGGFSAYSGV